MLAQGHPAARIVSVAAEVGADLTVLGSHGEGSPVDAMLGTTVQQVLTFSRGSVFVARPTPTAWTTPRRILVPLDGSARTECVLPTAARVARHHGAELVLVHVVSEPVPNAILSGENFDRARDLARRLEAGAEQYLRHIASSLAHEGLPMRTVVLRETDTRQAILELCEREHVDMMVVSAHGLTCNAARPFGTVASYLLSYARPALLVLQDLRETERLALGDEVPDERHATPLRGTPHTGPAELL
jgi:nucleotide-binding universal stress UspA family protein